MDVTTYYLEMLAPPGGSPGGSPAPPPRAGLTILHVLRPSVRYYRFLYDAVGQAYHWRSRGRLADAALAALIQDPLDEIHVLHVDGAPAGFAELDRRRPGEIELVQFGLMDEFIGQGLGKYFLHWVIGRVWSYSPQRFWLHTCTQDHPAALPNYVKSGLRVYKEETKKAAT